jgi:hypothetical protein
VDLVGLGFFVFFACSCAPFVRSILSVDFCCTKFADGPYYSVGRSVSGRTVRGPITDGALLRVQYWMFGGFFGWSVAAARTVCLGLTDGPPGVCGQST